MPVSFIFRCQYCEAQPDPLTQLRLQGAMREFVWKGQMSYMTAMHMVTRTIFNTNSAADAAGPEFNTGPAHYTHEETQILIPGGRSTIVRREFPRELDVAARACGLSMVMTATRSRVS